MSDLIRIPDSPWQLALIDFATDSCLVYCTSVRIDGHSAVVEARWPVASMSSGEQVAWRLLESMATGDLAMALDRLDLTNLRALFAVFDAARMAVTA